MANGERTVYACLLSKISFDLQLVNDPLLQIRGSQPPGPVPVPGLEEGLSGTRKVAKVVYFTQL